jgi:ATP-binding cassette subfamily B protein
MVIDKGQIIQQGTHNELIIKEGYYKALYKKQLQESTR